MWIWLLAVIIVAAAWVGHLVFHWFPDWVPILVTFLAVLMVIARLVGGRVRALLKAKALERELFKQAEQQALNARPDRRAEIQDLQTQMQRGLVALKQSPGGAAALYNLPWYMIIGPPGAGKTTALRQSGLAFPSLDARSGGGMRGVGGTRNCDWWFTNDAILLDTAGRYATESDDYDEWTAFLDSLKKYRPGKPINGVLVAISVTDLIDAREEQIDSFAKRLRARIDEVTARLQMLVPIYVLFTKVDLVAGFVEMFGDLRKSERGQIWGVSFPLAGADKREPGAAFEPEMDLMVERIRARALRRLGNERQPEIRPRIYQFPIEFAELKQNLVMFLGALLHPNNFRETPVLRGVYFTSGTQEGRPIDKLMGGMMAAFNLPAPPAGMPGGAQGQQTEAKSYFVTDLFKRVVFPDQHMAARTAGAVKAQLVNRLMFAVASLAVAACLILPSAYSFVRNMVLVQDLRSLADRTRRVDWADSTPALAKVRGLDELRGQVDQLQAWHDDGAPVFMGWGMYAGDKLLAPMRGVYARSLDAGFVRPTKAQLEHELAPAAGQAHLSIDQYGAYYSRLKAYVSIADPQRLQGDDGDAETNALTDAWARALGLTLAPDKETLKPHVAEYVAFVARGQVPPWTVDGALVARVRAALLKTSRVDRDYSALVREANDNVVPVARTTLLRGSNFAQYVTSRSTPEVSVRGAYTKAGWENFIRDGLDERRAKKLAANRWVLGESDQQGEQEIQQELAQIQQRYFVDYQAAWVSLLKDLEVHKPENDAAVLKELTALSEAPWPDQLLLQTLAENTRLQLSPESQLGKIGNNLLNRLDNLAPSAPTLPPRVQQVLPEGGPQVPQIPHLGSKRWVSPVEEAFAPMVNFGVPPDITQQGQTTGLSHYQEEIMSKLIAVLTDLQDAPTGARPDARIVTTAYQTAARATNELLDATQSSFSRPLLAPLLLGPIEK